MSNPNISQIGVETRFQRGKSGNPGGRPKRGFSLLRLLRKELESPCVDGSPLTRGEMVAKRFVDMAEAGSIKHAALLIQYIDGPPSAAMEQAIVEMAEELGRRYKIDPEELLRSFEAETGLAS